MSDTDWSTVRAEGPAAFELFFGYPDEAAYASVVEGLVADRVASGIAAQDGTLWGPDAESEASKRLAWVGPAADQPRRWSPRWPRSRWSCASAASPGSCSAAWAAPRSPPR